MNQYVSNLIAGSASIILALGLVHLLYTFRGSKLLPRDSALQARMTMVSPFITRETTIWRCWIGFNASHSAGAILFGAIYGYLSLVHSNFLLQSNFLLGLGLLVLINYAFLGWRYWFSVPHRSIILATSLYAAGLLLLGFNSK